MSGAIPKPVRAFGLSLRDVVLAELASNAGARSGAAGRVFVEIERLLLTPYFCHNLLAAQRFRGLYASQDQARIDKSNVTIRFEFRERGSDATVLRTRSIPEYYIDVVDRYIERVLDRKIKAVRGEPITVAHEALNALWEAAGAAAPVGPVPPELSFMDVIRRMPPDLARDHDAAHRTVLGERLTELFATAHRPYQVICGLPGQLIPFDWLERSTNQLRSIARFVREVADISADRDPDAVLQLGRVDRAVLEAAFEAAPPTSFRTLDTLLADPIWPAMTASAPGQTVELDENHASDQSDGIAARMAELAARIRQLASQGLISDDDRRFIEAFFGLAGDSSDAVAASSTPSDAADSRRVAAIIRKIERATLRADDSEQASH